MFFHLILRLVFIYFVFVIWNFRFVVVFHPIKVFFSDFNVMIVSIVLLQPFESIQNFVSADDKFLFSNIAKFVFVLFDDLNKFDLWWFSW